MVPWRWAFLLWLARADPACPPIQEGPELRETEIETALGGEVQFLQHGVQLQKMHRCDECMRAVFVVTSGRTGSTSILHMLNQIPGYDIKGGNYGLWKDIYAMNKERLSKWKGYKGSSLYAWHQHGRNSSELDCSLRLMLLGEINPDPDARVVGFRDSMWSFDENLKASRGLEKMRKSDLALLLQAWGVWLWVKTPLKFSTYLRRSFRAPRPGFDDGIVFADGYRIG
eukprot:s385_g19.t1